MSWYSVPHTGELYCEERVDRPGSYIVKNCTAFLNKEKFYFILLYEGIKGGQVV